MKFKTLGVHISFNLNAIFDLNFKGKLKQISTVLQSARPRAVALASYTGVDKIIKSTVGFTRKDI